MRSGLPIAGFVVIEAANIDEAVELVSATLCGGARRRRGLAAPRV